ncbi:MAG: TVP38/TMEM64 family protein [Bacillus sp. (in: firmicutes)]
MSIGDRKLLKKFMQNKPLKVLCAFIIVVVLVGFFDSLKALMSDVLNNDITKLETLYQEKVWAVYGLMLIIMIIQNSFTIIPLILVISLNVTLFGFGAGFLWAWFTSVIAAIIIFVAVRYFFHEWVKGKVNQKQLDKLEKHGFVFVFQARIFPFVPTSLINILAGLSTISFVHFTCATILGNFLYFFVLALIPAGLLSANVNEYVIAGVVLILFIIYYGYKLFYKKPKSQ